MIFERKSEYIKYKIYLSCSSEYINAILGIMKVCLCLKVPRDLNSLGLKTNYNIILYQRLA